MLTRSTFSASSHTCMPRDSNTSTQPRYLTANEHVDERTAWSSACHWCGLDDSGTRSLRRRKLSRNERRSRSILRGERNEAVACVWCGCAFEKTSREWIRIDVSLKLLSTQRNCTLNVNQCEIVFVNTFRCEMRQPTVFLTSPNVPRVNPLSRDSWACEAVLPMFVCGCVSNWYVCLTIQ